MSKEIKLPPLVPGTQEQNDLWDHVYEYTHTSEGVHERLEKVCKAYTIQAIEADRAERQGEAEPDFDDCAESPTGKHSASWFSNDNCEYCNTGEVSAPLYYAPSEMQLTPQEQEHVATVQCINGVTIGYLEKMLPVGTKLYTAHGIGGEK